METSQRARGELSLYAYPWDLAADGGTEVVDWAADHGVDRLTVATAYHSAEMLRPRSSGRVHDHVEANRVHLRLPDAPTDAVGLHFGELAATHPDLFTDIARRTTAAGLPLTAWVVCLHNSTVATAIPEVAMVNCFGDPLPHGLCPANPKVRKYVHHLVGATAATGHFDEVFVESLSFLPLGHGHPHELWSIPLDTADRTLASLCFCRHCQARGKGAGVDVHRLQQWVSATLRRRWNGSAAGARAAGDASDLLALVLARRDLNDYFTVRADTVTSLTREVRAAVREHGVRLAVGSPVFARPLPHAWLEGVDLGSVAAECDRMTLMPYYDHVPEVLRDLDLAMDLMPGARLQVLQTLWPTMHQGSGQVLLDKVRAARTQGVLDIGLYNWGTATESSLSWVDAVADLVHGEV